MVEKDEIELLKELEKEAKKREIEERKHSFELRMQYYSLDYLLPVSLVFIGIGVISLFLLVLFNIQIENNWLLSTLPIICTYFGIIILINALILNSVFEQIYNKKKSKS